MLAPKTAVNNAKICRILIFSRQNRKARSAVKTGDKFIKTVVFATLVKRTAQWLDSKSMAETTPDNIRIPIIAQEDFEKCWGTGNQYPKIVAMPPARNILSINVAVASTSLSFTKTIAEATPIVLTINARIAKNEFLLTVIVSSYTETKWHEQ